MTKWPTGKVFIALLLLLGAYVSVLYLSEAGMKRREFNLRRISKSRPYRPEFAVKELSTPQKEELQTALRQTYRYYGMGGQSYIFFSEDNRYVLKFFKKKSYSVRLWTRYFPLPWVLDGYRKRKNEQKKEKLFRDFASYKMAFEDLAEYTGVLFVHLYRTKGLTHLAVYDARGKRQRLALDDLDFIVQKKAKLVYPALSELMAEGQVEKAKAAIDSIVDFIVYRIGRGCHDRDTNISTNWGFLDGKAIKIDVGRLSLDGRAKDSLPQALSSICGPLEEWLAPSYPELALHLECKTASVLNQKSLEL